MDEGEALERLVRCYSPSGREGEAVREFVRLARHLGYRARTDRAGNGVAVRGRGRPEVLFLGHIDTVEGERPVRRRGGRVYGRGAVDAKGALVAALFGGAEFAGPGTYRVVAAVGEETDSRGARALRRGRRSDAVIAGEPSGWDGTTIGYRGDLRVEATFRGRRTHYGGPGATAGDRAVAWARAVQTRWPDDPSTSPFRRVTAKIVGLSGEFRTDEEVARVVVDVRLPPGQTVGEVRRTLGDPGLRPAIRDLVRLEPFETERRDPVVAALVAGIRAEGGRPTLWRKTGTSDLNLVRRAWRIPGAAYGPGDARFDHTDRERVPVRDVRRAARVLRSALERLVGPDGGLTPRGSGGGA